MSYNSHVDSDVISANAIFSNGGGGIEPLPGSADVPAVPVLTGSCQSNGGIVITGTLAGLAGTTYHLEFFANAAPDTAGNWEGHAYLGSTSVTPDASGNFTATLSTAVPSTEPYLTATATAAGGNTSEFSNGLLIPIFLAPLDKNLTFGLHRVIPIRFQLLDFNGAKITSLSAVVSLQIAPVNADRSLGTPFNPATTGNGGLRNDGGQYALNWQTKGLSAGSYAIVLRLADATVDTKIIQLSDTAGSAGLLSDAAGSTGSATTGALLGGDLVLYVDDSSGLFTGDELARIDDAVASVDATTAPYSVTIAETTDRSAANLILSTGSTSAAGGYADGVLGSTTDAGDITIIQGWSWYAGKDATQLTSAQYDFETVVTHELGHALGLGHSADANSVMYALLAPGAARRTLVQADLNVPDVDGGGPHGLHASVSASLLNQASAQPSMTSRVAFTQVLLILNNHLAASNGAGLLVASTCGLPVGLAIDVSPILTARAGDKAIVEGRGQKTLNGSFEEASLASPESGDSTAGPPASDDDLNSLIKALGDDAQGGPIDNACLDAFFVELAQATG